MDPLDLARAGHLARAQDDEPSPSLRRRSVLTAGGKFAQLFKRFSQVGL
jgi:hypothetical protein